MPNINCSIVAKSFPRDSKYFTETCFCELLELPKKSRSLCEIIKVNSDIEVTNTNLIETPIQISNEGQNLQGYKLIIELSIIHKLIYLEYPLVKCTCSNNPALCSNLGTALKSVFIVLPCTICGIDTCKLIRKNEFTVTPYIENISMQKVDCRHVYSTIDLFLDVTFNL